MTLAPPAEYAWPTLTIAAADPHCGRMLNGGPLRCVVQGPHLSHVYMASDAQDRHDGTEPRGHGGDA